MYREIVYRLHNHDCEWHTFSRGIEKEKTEPREGDVVKLGARAEFFGPHVVSSVFGSIGGWEKTIPDGLKAVETPRLTDYFWYRLVVSADLPEDEAIDRAIKEWSKD